MSLIANGINKVRIFEVPAGIWPSGEYFACPRVAVVRWSSEWADKLYQVYVDGLHAGTTTDIYQRQLVVHVPDSSASAVRIEVFAIEPRFANIDFSSKLSRANSAGRVKLRMLRNQLLPPDSKIQIYSDNGSGTVDFDNPINDEPLQIWPSPYDKAGFGTSRFGHGDFGFDSASASGFGMGDFGIGQLGLDTDSIEWTSRPLSKGIYIFSVKVIDKDGNQSDAIDTGPVTIMPAAKPVTALTVLSFDKQANKLVLSIN